MISVIIPAYNEENSIEHTVLSVSKEFERLKTDADIIVVNDGSTDNTGDIITNLVNVVNCKRIHHNKNKGYGAALKTGIEHATGDWILIIDADGTYPAACIGDLLRHKDTADMIVGSRNIRGQYLRRTPKYVLKKLSEWITGVKIYDLNSGLRLIKKSIVVRYMKNLPDGFSFTTTITLLMPINGFDICYVPIGYDQRTGKSKIRPVKDTLRFIDLIMSVSVLYRPKKIYNPLGLALGLIAGIKVVCDYMRMGHVANSTIMMGCVAIVAFMFGYMLYAVQNR